MILEALARLSAGRQWAITVPGTGERVLPGEIAALLAGCDQFGTDLLYAKFALDPHARHAAIKTWTRILTHRYSNVRVVVYRWEWLASGTIDAWIHGLQCPQCDGTAERLMDDKLVKCPACSGTGIQEPSERKKCSRIGLGAHLKNVERVRWAARYDECVAELDEIASGAERCAMDHYRGRRCQR